MTETGPALRLGTRGSALARWQAEWVANRLRRMGHAVELVEIATRGDVERSAPVEEIGTRGVFTKEIQRALLAGEVDLGVHSLKDLPTEPVDGLILAAVPKRGRTRDAIALPMEEDKQKSRIKIAFAQLPKGARIGTGSLRRQAQLRHLRPDLQMADVRGNVGTRLQKLDEGQFDAIVLAEAGLRRLGLAKRISLVLSLDVMLPAVGQGALGIECRAGDAKTQAILQPLEDSNARAAVTAERALLEHLRGGCMAPIAALGRVEGGMLHLSAVVLSADGSQRLAANDKAAIADAASLGHRVAESLLSQGAGALIESARAR